MSRKGSMPGKSSAGDSSDIGNQAPSLPNGTDPGTSPNLPGGLTGVGGSDGGSIAGDAPTGTDQAPANLDSDRYFDSTPGFLSPRRGAVRAEPSDVGKKVGKGKRKKSEDRSIQGGGHPEEAIPGSDPRSGSAGGLLDLQGSQVPNPHDNHISDCGQAGDPKAASTGDPGTGNSQDSSLLGGKVLRPGGAQAKTICIFAAPEGLSAVEVNWGDFPPLFASYAPGLVSIVEFAIWLAPSGPWLSFVSQRTGRQLPPGVIEIPVADLAIIGTFLANGGDWQQTLQTVLHVR